MLSNNSTDAFYMSENVVCVKTCKMFTLFEMQVKSPLEKNPKNHIMN